jgi:hypothetical protein
MKPEITRIFPIIYVLKAENMIRAEINAQLWQWCNTKLIIPEAIIHLMDWSQQNKEIQP